MAPDVFAALSNPIRRDLLDQLRRGPLPAGALTSAAQRRYDVGRPAISEHLKVLRDSGLVLDQVQGRERHYRLNAAPLREVVRWLADYERFWVTHLGQLADVLDAMPPDPPKESE